MSNILLNFAPVLQTFKTVVTGASGFIGSFIVEEALNRGFETWAAVRKGSSRRYLQDGRIRFVELDFDNPDGLRERLSGIGFNYVVHAAGATQLCSTRGGCNQVPAR